MGTFESVLSLGWTPDACKVRFSRQRHWRPESTPGIKWDELNRSAYANVRGLSYGDSTLDIAVGNIQLMNGTNNGSIKLAENTSLVLAGSSFQFNTGSQIINPLQGNPAPPMGDLVLLDGDVGVNVNLNVDN